MDKELVLSADEARELAEACVARAGFARFMASLFLYELTEEQIETFAKGEFPSTDSGIDAGMAQAKEYLRHRHGGTRQELAVDYARVFLGAGSYDKITAPPYESVFTSEEKLLMQEARDGALAYYRSIGLDLPAENTTPEDHAGFELQFAAEVADRTAAALAAGDFAEAAQLVELGRGFFTFHLANWLPALCDAVDEHAQTDFYHAVALMARGYVEEEAAFFNEVAALFGLPEQPQEVAAPSAVAVD